MLEPAQAAPPHEGEGFVHDLVLCCVFVPPPHDAEHPLESAHPLQSVHTPFTGQHWVLQFCVKVPPHWFVQVCVPPPQETEHEPHDAITFELHELKIASELKVPSPPSFTAATL